MRTVEHATNSAGITRGGAGPLRRSGELAKAEPRILRYRLLHTAARIIRRQRRRKIRIP